jgi:hypothetical protein
VNAPPPSSERTAVPLRVSSGFSKAVVSTSDGTIHSTGNFPSIVGDVVLTSGKWVFEVQVLEQDPTLSVPSAVVGWADSKQFFGDYAHDIGVGDDHFSWGVGVQRSRGLVRHNGTSQTFEPGPEDRFKLRQGSSFGCALDLDHPDGPQVLFGHDGSWCRAPAAGFSEFIKRGMGMVPAVSCRSDCQLQINFGASPFNNVVPEGFLPVHCQVTGDLPPLWLQYSPMDELGSGSTPTRGTNASSSGGITAPDGMAAPLASTPSGSAPTASVVLLMSQLRITCELLKLESAKLEDESLPGMIDKLEQDMKLITQRLATLGERQGGASMEEGVPP